MERGQASIEWLGAVALVALVLGGIGLATGGTAIGAAVVRQIDHALCLVRGGVCDLDRRPCVREANALEDGMGITVGFVRIGGSTLTLREYLSDGTVLVTVLDEYAGGVQVGGGLDVSAAAARVLAGGAARISLIASLGGGRTYAFSKDEAQNALAWLDQHGEPPQGRLVSEISETGHELGLEASAKLRDGTSFELELRARGSEGYHVDPATGRRTHVVRREGAAQALIALPDELASASGGGASEERLSVTTAADGTPLELSVVRTREVNRTYALPDVVQPIAEELSDGAEGHRRWVVEQRLDLTDPGNLAAARELLRALDGPVPYLVRATDELRARLADAGVTEARVYDVAREDGSVSGEGSAGTVQIGAGGVYKLERAMLTDARLKGPDGIWREAPACPVG